MPKHIKRIECCYCGASALINLSNPNEMHLVCSGCGARMSVDKLSSLSVAQPAEAAVKREVRFERPREDRDAHRRRYARDRDDDDDDDDDRRKPKKRKRRSFLKRLEDKLEDIWDEVEDIFD